jgi:hypothetical protein
MKKTALKCAVFMFAIAMAAGLAPIGTGNIWNGGGITLLTLI